MPLSEMQQRKIKWQTVDDNVASTTVDYSSDMSSIKVEPQRIRVFKVSAVNNEPKFLQ